MRPLEMKNENNFNKDETVRLRKIAPPLLTTQRSRVFYFHRQVPWVLESLNENPRAGRRRCWCFGGDRVVLLRGDKNLPYIKSKPFLLLSQFLFLLSQQNFCCHSYFSSVYSVITIFGKFFLLQLILWTYVFLGISRYSFYAAPTNWTKLTTNIKIMRMLNLIVFILCSRNSKPFGIGYQNIIYIEYIAIMGVNIIYPHKVYFQLKSPLLTTGSHRPHEGRRALVTPNIHTWEIGFSEVSLWDGFSITRWSIG